MFKTESNGFSIISPNILQRKVLKTTNVKHIISQANQNLILNQPLQRIILTPNKEATKVYCNQEITNPQKSRVINHHKSAMTPLSENFGQVLPSSTKVMKEFSSTNIQFHLIPADKKLRRDNHQVTEGSTLRS